jgi:hypothetical protein
VSETWSLAFKGENKLKEPEDKCSVKDVLQKTQVTTQLAKQVTKQAFSKPVILSY